jgi:hypothetical protein
MSSTALRRAAPAVLIAVLAATGAAIALPGASAQAPTTRTLTLLELDKGATFKHVRNTRARGERSIALGDLIVFTNPLADESGAKVGKLHASCTTTVGARNFMNSKITCAGVLALRDGTLTVQVITSPGARTSTGAVTGGTGAYANARGVLVSRVVADGSDDTITLIG